jgi:hypothetical protein
LQLAREGAATTPQHLARFDEPRRYGTLVAVLLEASSTLTEEILDLHDRFVGSIFNKAHRRRDEAFQSSGKAINEKVRLYARIGQALLAAKPFNRDRDLLVLAVGSPARLEVIETHLRSFRQISRERLDWCRYLQIFEDLEAAGNPRKAYSELLTRKCFCDKFEYLSEDASTDAEAVISGFKQIFCRSCPARDPKGSD